jgi:ribosomal protein S18 acetylase RimI-like enzyme
MEQTLTKELTIRTLAVADLDAVVAIDAAASQRTRRAYFERRVAAALREPAFHAQFAARDEHGLAGFILARVLRGEFGRSEAAFRLEAIGMRTDAKGHQIGALLLEALIEHGRRHNIAEVRTQAAWTNHAMLRWFDAMGFALAPNHVVDCAVAGGQYVPARDDRVVVGEGEGPAHEIDYGATAAAGLGNDFERLARDVADVRSMSWGDLDAVVRIDREITGRDRRDYMARQLAEAMDESSLRVSLVARREDVVAGYLRARADLGDFGRVEPVAVIDTIGVDPRLAHHGVGHALVSQLFVNLGALRIERVETIVAARDFALLGFLYDVGFAPSQRLPFVRRIGR